MTKPDWMNWKHVIHFDELHRGPRGERCFILEDTDSHQLILLQPLPELGDGEAFEDLAHLIAAAPDMAKELLWVLQWAHACGHHEIEGRAETVLRQAGVLR